MKERTVELRELRSRLSECLREVKGGRSIVVTERGRPVARIVPEPDRLEERLRTLTNAGTILWNGRRLGSIKPVARVPGRQTLADIVVTNRDPV
jgi:prevent-host-death family protein